MTIEEHVLKTRAIFEQYGNEIYRYVWFFFRNHEDAEDATQEVFVRVLRGLTSFKGQSSIRTWLWAIARNTVHDELRKRKRALKQLVATSPSIVTNDESRLVVEEAINTLTHDERDLIYLTVVQDISIPDAATMLGYSKSRAYRLYDRALAKLEKYFGEAMK